ncbi:MAG: cupin domain-containing protein [Atopobiaceae bacterium]|jgi:quercetin dioxygenase-like cupin family protein|nr:cupin domain-containing protein [Atopobiaceae bacterium]MCH4119384.1 cupin domain-containing protein [Atopobiaceae bacterium]MCI1318089.1 cupin domain-containing protein [Atopobiaceae bacterium]MCI1388971.1 cupin domain-containing protein [Atopobiaceae bacterium]MCI1431795.1 cupin domain-containing protein [Atopobiaceae bacterium]
MFHLNQSEREFRNGDNGPKYLMKGPRVNFGIVRLNPGDTMAKHLHRTMEENFYVMEGNPTFTIDGTELAAQPGDFIHVEPGEAHEIENRSDAPCLFVINTDPYIEAGDKVLL